jgi:transposase
MAYLFYKIVKGRKYYYLGENKSINGQSRRVLEIYLGSADNLMQYTQQGTLPKEVESISYGLPASLLNIGKDINFVKMIDKHCSKREQGLSVGEHILIDLINRIDEPLSHNKLGDWFSKTMLRKIFKVKPPYLSSQGYWNHWQYFDEEIIENIQKDILPKIIKGVNIKQLFYDPTNFTTYISNKHKDSPKGMKRHKVSMAKYGKPKNGLSGLKQINLALLVTKDYGIPLWHKPYDGNINDVTFFQTFVDSLQDKINVFLKECKSITLIFDKGNNSPKNVKRVGKNLHFYTLGSLAPSQHKEWLKIPLDNFDVEHKTTKKDIVKAHYFRAEVFGKQCSVVITYNRKTAYNQKERTERALAKGLAYLKKAKAKLNNPQWKDRDTVLVRINSNLTQFHAKKLIKWSLTKDNKKLSLSFSRNKKELSYAENSYGKSILFTNNDSLNANEIIKAYNNKYVVEHDIKRLKNRHVISYTPQNCWTDESCRIHAFTCVMALLFFSLLRKKVGDAKLKISDDELVYNLREIKQALLVMPKTKKVRKMIEKMSPTQKKLYSLLNLKKYES